MPVRQRKPTSKSDSARQTPIDAALLASFDKAQEFHITLTEAGKVVEKTVVCTLEEVMDRGVKYLEAAAHREYDRRKNEWLRLHPDADSKAYEQACREIARLLQL